MPGTVLPLTIVSDAICPWCWVGKRRLEGALAILARERPELRFELSWFPFELNPDMPPEGIARVEYRRAKFGSVERGRQLDAQLAEVGAAIGLEFRFEAIERTPNTVDAHRLSRFAAQSGCQAELIEALFRAYFHEGRDIGEAETLVAIGASVGLEAASLRERLASDEGVQEVVDGAAAAAQSGIGGVPAFILGRVLVAQGAMPETELASLLSKAATLMPETEAAR